MKKAILILLVVFALLLPPIFVIGSVFILPPVYDETFVGALDEKFERLNSLEGDKIVVVGGSSVAFGLDSRALEEYTGMPVVNFGLYAALGTKMMLDLSLSGIDDGDIVIVAPEMNKETLSLYFNADTAWRAIESDFSMLKYIGKDNRPSMVGALWGYGVGKIKAHFNGGIDFNDSIYSSDHFNEYGDFDNYPRMDNIMPEHYDPNTEVALDPSAFTEEFFEFADYLNEYVKKCNQRGAKVYFSFSPMNSLACDEVDDQTLAQLYSFLSDNLDCELISVPEDYILDPGYFFDTNFHMNDTGVVARTILLARDIRLAEGITTGVLPEIPPPRYVPILDPVFDGYDENSKYFTYELRKNGTYSITGLTEEGRSMTELTVPLGYNGYKVLAIKAGALRGSSVETLIVTEDSNLVMFENGAFSGAGNLRSLVIYKHEGSDIAPPADFSGVHRSFKVYIPEGSDFPYHYYWSERGLTFEIID